MPQDLKDFDFYDHSPLLIVISGPSGVGKDSVIKALLERDLPLHKVVTATSRAARIGEIHARDYFFVSATEFETMIERNELIEHSIVYKDYKGIPKDQVVEAFSAGKDVILRVDVQGAAKLRAMFADALLIFLLPTNGEELAQRLISRKSESEESLKVRLETLKEEMDHLPEFDYMVVNNQGHLDETVDTIVAIIHAEHHRVHQRKVAI